MTLVALFGDYYLMIGCIFFFIMDIVEIQDYVSYSIAFCRLIIISDRLLMASSWGVGSQNFGYMFLAKLIQEKL